MTILYLHQYFNFPSDNGSTRSYDLATSFVAKGFNVIIITAFSDKKFKNKNRWNNIIYNGINIHYIYLPYNNSFSYFKRIVVFFKFVWFTSIYILKLKGDVLIATSTPLTVGIPALLKKWIAKTPYIFEVRDVWPEVVIAIGAIKNKIIQVILYKLEKISYKYSTAIVPLSVDMKLSIDKRYPEFKFKTNIIIPNLSEIYRFQHHILNVNKIENLIGFSPRFSILYAGTFGKVNGIEYVVKLAKFTLDFDKHLVYILIGDGSEKEYILYLAGKEGVLNKNLFILEPVSKNELPIWYASASMASSFVINIKELWANSANKYFDSLAASKPILINYGGWQASEIRNRNIGYVLPTVITRKSALDFVKYTFDEVKISKQKEQALILAKEQYSLEVASTKYVNIFNSLKSHTN